MRCEKYTGNGTRVTIQVCTSCLRPSSDLRESSFFLKDLQDGDLHISITLGGMLWDE